jgi:hypothetical protein
MTQLEWPGARVRAAFNEFFQSKAHTYWASNAVVSSWVFFACSPRGLVLHAACMAAITSMRCCQASLLASLLGWRARVSSASSISDTQHAGALR